MLKRIRKHESVRKFESTVAIACPMTIASTRQDRQQLPVASIRQPRNLILLHASNFDLAPLTVFLSLAKTYLYAELSGGARVLRIDEIENLPTLGPAIAG